MSQVFLSALRGDVTETLPFWLMRQAGRYLPEYREIRSRAKHFLELCYTPDLAAEITLQPVRRFSPDAAILFSDILVIPDALGMQVGFVEGEGPKLEPISTAQDISALGGDIHQKLQPVYETIRITKGALPVNVTLIGFSGAPWTLACYMLEGGGSKNFDKVRAFAYCEPEACALLEILVDAIVDYVNMQVEYGVQVIQLFDSWAGAASAAHFEEWITRPTQEIVRRVKEKHPDIPIIGFPRLAGMHLKSYAAQTGVDAVSIDYQTSLEHARRHTDKPLQGNLDPLLLATDARAACAYVDASVEIMQGRPYIFNLGHGVVPQTPPEHVQQLAEHIRSIRRV